MRLLEAAVRGGVTPENVAVVKELLAMRREELAMENKRSFNRSFFLLKQKIAQMEICADKAGKNKSGAVIYTYASESELADKLEPVLAEFGFAMMFGQKRTDNMVIAEITLIHRDGHEEKREYAVRVGRSNEMKDDTAVDSGSTTSAWRHLVIKLFGLKSRIMEESDMANEGSPISFEQSETLRELVKETNSDEAAFLRFAGAVKYEEIGAVKYDMLFRALDKKRSQK